MRLEQLGNIKLYNADCIDVLKSMEDESVDLVIADPPYNGVIDEMWDNLWQTEQEYISWVELWFNEVVRVLKPTGVFYCYGWFDILTKLKVRVFDKRLIFRQNITLDKGIKSVAGRTSSKLRMYPTASEYLLYYVKNENPTETPFSIIMKKKMKELKLTQIDVARLQLSKNGNITGWVHNKLNGKQLPTREQWALMCELFDIRDEYDLLVAQYEMQRYTFNLPYGVTDVWDFAPDKDRYHPTQKPMEVCDRIIQSSSNEGDIVFIPFAGSGNEIISAVENRRVVVASEIDEGYYKIIKNRVKTVNEK